jgi:two-component system sensor histidine kinase EvgS
MKAWRAILLIIWIVSAHGVHAQGESPVELELSGYSYITPVPVYLSEDDRRWLQQKRALRVGVYLPGQPPLVQTTLTGRYRGMNADYLTLIHYSLNIRITVLGYQNRADAIRALRAGEIDTVLTGLDTRPSVEEDPAFCFTGPFLAGAGDFSGKRHGPLTQPAEYARGGC